MPDAQISGDRTGAQERLLLPKPGALAQVFQITLGGRYERSDRAPGTQPHVHAIEEALAGRCGEAGDQPLAETLVLRSILGRQEQQVDIRAIVELASAQLAHREHDELARRDPHALRDMRQAGAHDSFGQVRELLGDRRQVEQRAQVADADAQELGALEPAQRVESDPRIDLHLADPHRSASGGLELAGGLDLRQRSTF